mmetsp:Transcript_64213/g.184478  ORF Transcript_64213/g.184478 Transcript_64213/m.184478 type:complete len:514 (-) Transcript_64213:312-1853(-)
MVSSKTSPLWRSKLRRLQTLAAWERSAVGGAELREEAGAQKLKAESSAPKRCRLDSSMFASTRPDQEQATPSSSSSCGKDELRKQLKATSFKAKPAEPMQVDADLEQKKPQSTPPALRKRKMNQHVMALAVRVVLIRGHRKATPLATPPKVAAVPAKETGVHATLQQPAVSPPHPSGAKPKMDAAAEIQRILTAEAPQDVLDIAWAAPEEIMTSAWKKLVLLLHPDKLQRLPEKERQAGAEALHRVNQAKEELRKSSQAVCAQIPAMPFAAGPPRCLESTQGQRKYEISWVIPESQDPSRPIENYEIWGPRYFSEVGDPYDFVLLATLPPLQSQFVLVEEAPTQQDVMWASDRVLRPSMPLTVHAVNGKGQSEALTFECPWAMLFPWLRGTPSVLCNQCFRMSECKGAWTKCNGCMVMVPGEQRIVVRCADCQGEVLWAQGSNMLRCTCCLKIVGKDMGQQWRPGTKPFHTPPLGPPQVKPPQYNSANQRLPPRPPSRPPPQFNSRRGAAKAW